jgi:hypothetical protein
MVQRNSENIQEIENQNNALWPLLFSYRLKTVAAVQIHRIIVPNRLFEET